MSKPTFRLIACDLDGTLLQPDARFGKTVPQFLDDAQDAGYTMVAATGRRRFSAWPLVQAVKFGRHCVVHNGAVVIDVASGQTTVAKYFPAQLTRELIVFLRERELAPLVYTDQDEGPGELFHEQEPLDPTGFLAHYIPYVKGHATAVRDLAVRQLDQVVRVVTHQSEERLHETQDELMTRWRGTVRSFIGFDQAHRVHRLEILDQGATKWARVAELAEQMGISTEQILAVGDDSNDREMLEGAGHSMAAPGANLVARTAAAEVLEGTGPDDVVLALRRHLGL